MAKGQELKVNGKQLADVFGVSLPTVDAWVRQGCPSDQQGGRGREWVFDTADDNALKRRKPAADIRATASVSGERFPNRGHSPNGEASLTN